MVLYLHQNEGTSENKKVTQICLYGAPGLLTPPVSSKGLEGELKAEGTQKKWGG